MRDAINRPMGSYPDQGTATLAQVGPIRQALSELNSAITDLDGTVQEFQTRISPILGPDNPQSPKSGIEPPKPNSPITLDIDEQINRVRSIINHIRYLNQRVEL